VKPSLLTSKLTHALAFMLVCTAVLGGCQAASKEARKADVGTPSTEAQMIAALSAEGILTFQKHRVARWQVPLSGLLNLDHPAAIAAGLEDRSEPIEIYTYSLTHPKYGSYLVDSGLSERFRGAQVSPDISSLVNAAMGFDTLKLETTTGEIASKLAGIDGVFLTHIHLDHILGLTDLHPSTPVYVGPGDAQLRSLMHAFSQGTTDRLLGGQEKLLELQFDGSGILDVFNDGSFFAIHAPGHTPGTTVYIANTTAGVQVLLGDVSHTRWGWDNQVEPGTYSHNQAQSATSLARIKHVTDKLQNSTVHPGHQVP